MCVVGWDVRSKGGVITGEGAEGNNHLGGDAADVDGAPDAPAQTVVLHAPYGERISGKQGEWYARSHWCQP